MASDQPKRPSLYPTVDTSDLENLSLNPQQQNPDRQLATQPPIEEKLLTLHGAILHLIDTNYSVELSSGDLSVLRLRQDDATLAILLCVGSGDNSVQWPLARDEPSVKLDAFHYFFSLHVPRADSDAPPEMLNYGLTFTAGGQGEELKKFDSILDSFGNFSEQVVSSKGGGEMIGRIEPAEVGRGLGKEGSEERSAAYWTTLAPNVEDYSGRAAKGIAAGSGHVVKGIIWCGEVTVERLRWGDEFLRRRMGKKEKESKVSEETLRRIRRAKSVTRMSEKVATGILSGVVKVSGYVTSSVVNSRAGKKFFSLLPGEIVLASLDGFGKMCDAVEVAGKNVMSTSSDVTTGLVSHRYGEQAAEATNEGLGAAGHAIGTAWAVFKIRQALNPKSSLKPTTIVKTAAKAAAAEHKVKRTN